ncbi:MAG: AAC(3) family N-acetyltransferase [Turicibacter sp.]|nr:AAC(3) family N-acetyltransferase [Turicibacter sp.]
MQWITKEDIISQLAALDLNEEEILLVYGDVPEDSRIVGGVQTVMEAIFEAVGMHTTIVMPAHRLTPKPVFFDPSIPKDVRGHVPAFDVNLTPVVSTNLSQAFAMHKSSVRSNHPLASFLAIGHKAAWLMKGHDKHSMFGNGSPLEKAYAQGAKLLCIGVDANRLTALHLLNYLNGKDETFVYEAPVVNGGEKEVVAFKDLKLDASAYGGLLEKYAQKFQSAKVEIGNFSATLFDYRELIDFGASEIGTEAG